MFMVRIVRKTLSLPLLWVGQAAAWGNLGIEIPLLSAAWYVSGDGETARIALARVFSTRGAGAALVCAKTWMNREPSPEIAAMGGLMAIEKGQIDTAREFLAAGQQAGMDREGMLELLEWQLAMIDADNRTVETLIDRFEARKDLSPLLRRMILVWQMWRAVVGKRFDEVDRRAGSC